MNAAKERSRYRPGPAELATASRTGDRFTLEVTRVFGHPPARLWRLLTDPGELREWAPFDSTFDLGETGTATLSLARGARAVDLPSHIRIAEAPRLLEYTWGSDVLVWELEPMMSETLLTLRHTMDDPRSLARAAAGWQICLDVAGRHLEGRPIGRIVGAEAKQFDWERLHAEYASRFAALAASRDGGHGAAAPPRPDSGRGGEERRERA